MDYPDKIVISGFPGGLGQALAKSLPVKNVVGINRQLYYPGWKCKQFVLDISDFLITEKILCNYAENLGEKTVALVLAAGRLGEAGGIVNSNLGDWEYTFRTNVLGNAAVIRAFLKHMFDTKYGRIIFIAGGGAAYGFPEFTGYSLSKVAIVREVENIAEQTSELPYFSIIALAPGAMETKMLQQVKKAGGKIKTTVDIKEPIEFIKNFITMDFEKAKSLSGKFIHVRDDLESPDFENKWLLRRMEK